LLFPDNVDDVSAAGIPVAYLTAQVVYPGWFSGGQNRGWQPAIGGSIGNRVTQLARAMAQNMPCRHDQSCESRAGKGAGFNEGHRYLLEKLGDGVRRNHGRLRCRHCHRRNRWRSLERGARALALNGTLQRLGYSASRKTTIDVTNLIVPQASISGLNMFAQPQAAVTDAWKCYVSLLKSGEVKPIVAKTFPLARRLMLCVT